MSTPFSERGISLLEALISVLLIAITGLGLAHVTVQSLAVQRYATTENQVLLGLREAMLAEPGVSSVPVAGSEMGFARQGETVNVRISVGGVERVVSVEAARLSVTSDPAQLVGGDGRFELGYGAMPVSGRGAARQRGISLISLMIGLLVSLLAVLGMMALYRTVMHTTTESAAYARLSGDRSAALLAAHGYLQEAGFGIEDAASGTDVGICAASTPGGQLRGGSCAASGTGA